MDGVTIAPAEKISILGFTLDNKLGPQVYLKELADGILYRKHVVGRLSAHLPPHVLKMFARATVLEKIRTYIHLSLKVRLSESDPLTAWGRKLQVILNDVARIVVKKRRSDHVRVEDLLEGVNAMVCSSSAMLAHGLEDKPARKPTPRSVHGHDPKWQHKEQGCWEDRGPST